MYDVMIIGAGVTGSAIARELMRKKRKVAVLERCSDICEGTSKANSGIVHAGFDATPGTLKAKMNVQGSKRMEALSKELVTDYKALADEIESWNKKVFCSFIPGNLDYLKAGGRVSHAAYLGATLLRLKPLIEIVDGQLLASKKYRGSIEKFVDTYMEEYLAKHDVSRKCLYLMYSKGLSQVALDRMKENAIRFGFESYEYVMTGCVISCHSGPGAIGLAGCCE